MFFENLSNDDRVVALGLLNRADNARKLEEVLETSKK